MPKIPKKQRDILDNMAARLGVENLTMEHFTEEIETICHDVNEYYYAGNSEETEQKLKELVEIANLAIEFNKMFGL